MTYPEPFRANDPDETEGRRMEREKAERTVQHGWEPQFYRLKRKDEQ